MILVDSNIWIDIMAGASDWRDWSVQQLKAARAHGGLAINPVIYAELSSTFDSKAGLDAALAPLKLRNTPISDDAAFLAGQAFWQYRQRKGSKSGVLPDFFIGAHAQAEGWALLTRDTARYRTYFPGVKLICPD